VIINPDTGDYRALAMPDPTLFTACSIWSPDSKRLACEGFGQTDPGRDGIYTIRASDGKGLRRMTSNPGGDDVPGSYSPDGRRFAFARFDANGDGVGIFVVRTDGSGLRRITPRGTLATPGDPGVDWSPQGNQIVFSLHATADLHSSIWIVHANGSGLREVNVLPASMCGGANSDPLAVGCFNPRWSPDGSEIVFGRGTDATGRDIYTVRTDGTGLRQITHTGVDTDPDWGAHPLIH
jgi:Tol biopolymer transport system component